MKIHHISLPPLFCAAVFLFFLTGCTSYLSFTSTIPGEYNLGGVSKIALVGFNTLPNDPASGVRSADGELMKLTEDMIASAFSRGNVYRVANLDIEKMILDSGNASARPARRFDAVICGRVWWQISPQNCNIYPHVYQLKTWSNIRYMSGRDPRGRPVFSVKPIITRLAEQAVVHYYRAVNATLMLSITVYRLGGDGKVEKIISDFAAADQQYLLDNGVFSTYYSPHDKASASLLEQVASQGASGTLKAARSRNETSGYLNDNMNSSAIPDDLQTKIMLALKLTSQLSRKLTPSEIPIELERDFDGGTRFLGISWGSDEKLISLINRNRYGDVCRYAAAMVRRKAGNGIADRIGSICDYPAGDGEVPADPSDITDGDVDSVISSMRDYLYAMAIGEEALRRYEAALALYRDLFRVLPEKKYALGISRCLASLGSGDRLRERKVSAEKAGNRASLK